MEEVHISCNCIECEFRSVIFQNLTPKEFGFMCQKKREKKFQKGETIIHQGNPIKEFLYLKSGLVKLFQRDSKKHCERIIRIAKPYDFVSLLTVFSDKSYHFSITAIEESVVCYIDLESIRTLIQNNGMLGLQIMEKMSKNSDTIIQNNIEINKRNLRGRIAYILMLFYKDIYKNIEFELPITRKEIGQLINMSTENVIRIFSEFRKDKIIRINGKDIEILNIELLDKISQLG